MRISVLSGLLVCSIIIGVSSNRAGAISVEDLQKTNIVNDSSELLTYADQNGLIQDNSELEASKTEPISPEVKHTVVEGETLSKVAEDYKTTWKRIYDKNLPVANPNIVNPGDELTIPSESEVLVERELPVVKAVMVPEVAIVQKAIQSKIRTSKPKKQVVARTSPPASRGSSNGNRYVAGYCTWYVKNVRTDMPNNLGDARTWVSRAASQGMATGSTPSAGAVGQRANHVVYVESVNGDGTMTISEMNYRGLYTKTVRTISPAGWNFIY